MKSRSHVPQVLAGMLAGAGLLLGGCAGGPAERAMPISGEQQAAHFNTGRVMVVVTDFAGKPLKLARVDVESGANLKEYFRTAAFSDVFGRVTFSGVPSEVRISVYHAETQGNYSREFQIPPSGTTELRMMVEPQN